MQKVGGAISPQEDAGITPFVPINSDYGNIAAFINSLFDADVRTLDAIKSVIEAGQFLGSFSSENDKILAVWKAAWQAAQGDPHNAVDLRHCPASDKDLFEFLSAYVGDNGLALFVPALRYLGLSDDGPPIYELSAYQGHDFKQDGERWNYETVEKFLKLLMAGAHIVVVHAPRDLPPGVSVAPLWKIFRGDDELVPSEKRDIANSHYTHEINIWGEYYPKVEKGTAPGHSPFVLSLLVCPSVSDVEGEPDIYNTFIQLEGWEAVLLDPRRHMADYESHEKTLWNISTFGFCAYSEKRATAVFLAPPSWDPQIASNTFMPPYVGAESRQDWLETHVVRLPSSYWKVIVRADCCPRDDQKHRTSDNLALDPPEGAKRLKWTVQNSDNPDGISFELWKDVKLFADEVVLTGLGNNTVTETVAGDDKYYIANPKGCTDSQDYFEVVVEAIS
jgi:hypothetical protein